MLKPVNKGNGYLRFVLCCNGRTKRMDIHRLVALAFIPNPEEKPCVNHLDGNPSNNCINNLEWATEKENAKHACDVLKTMKPPFAPKGKGHFNNKPVLQFSPIGEYIGEYASASVAEVIFAGKSTSAITKVCAGANKSAFGFIWRYKDKLNKKHKKLRTWQLCYSPKNKNHASNRAVLQFSTAGKFIAEYSSIAQAGFALTGRIATTIVDACKGRQKTALGFCWQYKFDSCVATPSRTAPVANM